MIRPQRKGSRSIIMKEVTIGELQGYLSNLIRTHSLRVEHFKLLLKCNALEVERDIKQTVNCIWGKRWLLLWEYPNDMLNVLLTLASRGQVDTTLLQATTRDYTKRRREKKNVEWDAWDLDTIGREYEEGLRRRPRVTPRKMNTIA